MTNVLVVEDDTNLRMTLEDLLELEGYQVQTAESITQAKTAITEQGFDLIVLDIMLPDGNGYEYCQWLREQNFDPMVLMLTARNLEQDLVTGFTSGADDYLTKPYRSQELLLRIQALLRRKGVVANKVEITDINGFKVDWSLRQVQIQNQDIHLTKTAFNILLFLFNHKNQVASREQILDAVWGENVYVDNRTVDNFISQLKKSLTLQEGNPVFIKSVRGVGYSLVFTPTGS